LDPVEGSWRTDHSTASIDGVPYAHSLTSCRDEVFEFDLSRDYSVLQATVGVVDSARADTMYLFEVYVDEQPRLSQVLELGTALPVEVDVANGLRLSLRISREEGDISSCLAIGEARLG
jgi:hypothetical protein